MYLKVATNPRPGIVDYNSSKILYDFQGQAWCVREMFYPFVIIPPPPLWNNREMGEQLPKKKTSPLTMVVPLHLSAISN